MAVSWARFLAVWFFCFALLAGAAAGALLAVELVLAPRDQSQFSRLLELGANVLVVFGAILFGASGLIAGSQDLLQPFGRNGFAQ